MCGIVGFFQQDGASPEKLTRVLGKMQRTLFRRGPDDGGIWSEPLVGVYLAHRRLSVLDLTSAGHQPKVSKSHRYIIVYNGEIYNHIELRTGLEKEGRHTSWDGHSDTETLLACIEAWGLEDTLRRANGMFAIALWDQQRRTLSLARDRFGEKPLYYGWQGRGQDRVFLFGSELKALEQHPSFEEKIDGAALTQFMQYSYVPEPRSIWAGIAKLAPGFIVNLDCDTGRISQSSFWTLLETATSGMANRNTLNEAQTVLKLEELLMSSVRRQMISDVPLGAFLSGGIDSSLIVALMQAQSNSKVKTYTIGFSENSYDESLHARAVARHLSTDHHELQLTSKDALDVIPELPKIYCEPFADSSQIPTFLVCKMARESVTVCLSGDAGDEVFGGYNRYVTAAANWKYFSKIPKALRSSLGASILKLSPDQWDRLGGKFAARRFRAFGDKMHKIADAISSETLLELHVRLSSTEQRPSDWIGRDYFVSELVPDHVDSMKSMGSIEAMMALDTLSYLPGDILTKVDRAAMANSLETRLPFLDPDVVSFAWSISPEMKIKGGVSKWPLRQILYKHVPQELIDRPKTGFGIPIATWLRGPLREWAEHLINEKRLGENGYWQARHIRKMWEMHLRGDRNMASAIWPVLMFEAWRAARL